MIGQQVPAICRPSPTNPSRLELVSGVLRLAAIRTINEGRPEDPLPLLVEVRAMDDRQASALVDAENRVRTDIAPSQARPVVTSARPDCTDMKLGTPRKPRIHCSAVLMPAMAASSAARA